MSEVTRSIVINASQEKVFKVIADFENYPEFLPEIKDVTIEKSSSKEVIAAFTLQLMKEIGYRLKLKLKKPSSITWKMIDGDVMSHNNGSWKLKKLSAKKTEAVYSIDVGFGSFVPGFISNTLISRNLPTMMDNFKERIENG